MDNILYVLIIILCLFFQAFFSGSEIALIASSRVRLRGLANQGNRRAKLLLHYKEQPERFLPLTLIGTNLSEITGSTIATSILISYVGTGVEFYVTAILTPLFLLFGEMLPKTVFRERSDIFALNVVYPLRVISIIFYPAAFIIRKIAKFMTTYLNMTEFSFPSVSRDEILSLLRNKTGRDEETRMIERVLKFNETRIKEVMVPLVEVVAFDSDAKVGDVADSIKDHPYSSFPVYEERIDNMVGVVRVLDLLRAGNFALPLKYLMLAPIFVQESLRAVEVLPRLKELHMAVVVDEYGGATGIVTVEDIMEEVVGEIEGEHGIKLHPYKEISKRNFLVQGRAEIDRLNEMLGLGLPEGDYKTIAGFLITKLGRLPGAGEIYRYRDIAFTIRKASERTIEEVLIRITPEEK